MPQMSPMWWLTMMITLNMMLLTMNTMTYFEKKKLMKIKKKMISKKMNWKW